MNDKPARKKTEGSPRSIVFAAKKQIPLMRGLSAVHGEGLTGREAGGRRGQENNHFRDLFRFRRPSCRYIADYRLPKFGVVHPSFGHRSLRKSRRNRVHPNALRRIFDPCRFGQSDHAMFRGNVRSHERVCNQPGYGSRIHNRTGNIEPQSRHFANCILCRRQSSPIVRSYNPSPGMLDRKRSSPHLPALECGLMQYLLQIF